VDRRRGDGGTDIVLQHRAVTTYRIVVEGEISDRFFATFGDLRVDHVAGETWMTGEIADQAQLQGVIAHIADLGLALRSVGPVALEVVEGGHDDGHAEK
jgi:hypothetical protein